MAISDAGELPPPPHVASHHGSVGLFGAIALVAGSMVGSGIFLLPVSLGAIGSISILGWLAATAAALAVAGVFAWLPGVAPRAKGLPDYVEAGLGPFFGVQTSLAYWRGAGSEWCRSPSRWPARWAISFPRWPAPERG